jgi:hypothetical protein
MVKIYSRVLFGLLVALGGSRVSGSFAPTAVRAAAMQCPNHRVCDNTLGLTIRLPPAWVLLPKGKYPPHTLAFALQRPVLENYTERLVIEPYALTSIRNDKRAVDWVATKVIAAERRGPVTQRRVAYGGAPGVVIRGLPGEPGPVLTLLLAHQEAVYRIIIPGASIGTDQQSALASLHFIVRKGPFLPPVGG